MKGFSLCVHMKATESTSRTDAYPARAQVIWRVKAHEPGAV
jgi:hypothetical protein